MQEPTVVSAPRGAIAPSRGARLSRALRLSVALLFAAVAGASLVGVGCKTVAGKSCVGGVVLSDGSCVAKCESSKCLEGNTCVDNVCVLQCTSHEDCYSSTGVLGTQDCTATKNDDGKAVSVCKDNGKAKVGTECAFGTECATVTSCPNGDFCDVTQCGGGVCAVDDLACQGEKDCHIGKCPDGKTPCTVAGCAAADCKPTFCHSKGVGDSDAYCTTQDCKSDADCAGGYYCGQVRDPHDICGPVCTSGKCVGGSNDGGTCTNDSGCQKGNNAFCGTTKDPCIDPSAFTANGATYAEGPICLMRNQCLKRGQCDTCATDLDCSVTGNQHCKKVGTESVCLHDCASDADCEYDAACLSGSCTPRAGACKGAGNFCDPCRLDSDCMGKNGRGGCASLTGAQTACIDEDLPITCTKDTDCPTAPGGLHGTCLDENEGASPSDSSYHHCYFPFNIGSDKFSCWCSPVGSPCTTSTDCCSKSCKGAVASTGQPGTCACKVDADCGEGRTCSAGACVTM